MFEDVQDPGDLGTWILRRDLSPPLVEWSRQTFAIFRLDQETFAPSLDTFYAHVHPEDVDAVRAAAGAMTRGEAEFAIQHRILRGDGSIGWVRAQAAHVDRNEAGEPIRIIGTVLDLTARRQREAQMRCLFDSDILGILVWDENGRIVDANDSLLDLVGYTRRDLTAGIIDWKALTPPEHDVRDRQALEEIRLSGRCRPFEKEYLHRSGRRIPILVAGASFEGESNRGVAFVLDLTARRALEEQVVAAQKMDAIGRLAGGVAHDFNNILSAILGYAGFVAEELPRGSSVRADVEEIVLAAERAAALTRQLLAFGRKQLLVPRPVDVAEMLRGLEPMLRRVIRDDVELRFELTDATGWTRADPAQLQQIVVNLVTNAHDAMRSGGRITITSGTLAVRPDAVNPASLRAGDYVVLSVSDDGPSLDDASRARIFEPFFSRSGSKESPGLGLATVFGTVKQSGGHIEVDSGRGGTRFTIYLPREEAEPEEARPEPYLRGKAETRTSGVVLLVEDEVDVRAVTRRLLQKEGFTVLDAVDGMDALRRARAHEGEIDVLVTDVIMPRMGGRSLADELLRERPSVSVVFMSGYTEDFILADGGVAPGASFLLKPVRQEVLVDTVSSAVARARRPSHDRG